MKKSAIRFLVTLALLALLIGSAGYWIIYISAVTVMNQSPEPINGAEVDLGAHILRVDAIAPGNRITIYGATKQEGTGWISLHMAGQDARRSLGYMTPGLPQAYTITIQSPQKITVSATGTAPWRLIRRLFSETKTAAP